MFRVFAVFLLAFQFIPIACAAEQKLASQEAREFFGIEPEMQQKKVPLKFKAESIDINYSSDVPLKFSVAYPEDIGEIIRINPLDVISIYAEPGENRDLTIDLTMSPAWSPSREEYNLYIAGEEGGVVSLQEIAPRSPSFTKTISASISHIFVDEPKLLSSVNFFYGYKVLGVSFVKVFGIIAFIFLISKIAYCIIFKKIKQISRSIVVIALMFLFLYDARFSLDLVKTTFTDLSEWVSSHEYRQLGPLYKAADYLRMDADLVEKDMKVAMCFDSGDIVHKYLRYDLYPISVTHDIDNWNKATHVVSMATNKLSEEDGMISCGDTEKRHAVVLKTFNKDVSIYRFIE
ncbi:hypothetical protein HOF56_02020 [Candidatus Peribacteria bacterium]|jgi:hypothetical protein|nr:hypothetical protein [Candidatus Peribacteria bacterium]MBT4021265.1 hypothetical protein [Candidatus Peribacteria bacterium]MBT4240670.1 hypothetical protein [Candidatus Peribacteria bacterium]MBT4474015.1 hypothetical protein [Candidatus Peribacteria bacterium]